VALQAPKPRPDQRHLASSGSVQPIEIGIGLMAARSNDGSFTDFAHATLQFRCLSAGDPELHRPTFHRAPNVVIENK
jgi:hypothetical protein